MPALRLGSRDLLEYNAKYGVLICRKCQYAIQKSALRSHLLRHKIYRDERHRLLFSIAQLQLFESHLVPLPDPASPPIDGLPIIAGYRCPAAECGNLCASSKRMRRHWSEIHGLSEPPSSSCFARPVKLQTFFRGTKLRYFEVTSSPAAAAATGEPLATTTTDNQDNDNEMYDKEDGHEQVHIAGTSMPLSPRPSPADFDLETLTYFHHFTTATSLTLPGAERYWQVDVVLQALRQRWLMYGLLALSACHMAVLADDTAIERAHRERSAQWFSKFSSGWEEITKKDDLAEEEAKKVGGKIRCLLRCDNWAVTEYTQLQTIMMIVRGFVAPGFALRQEEIPAQARSLHSMPSALLSQLHTLPSRMAEALGKPEDAQDVLVTLSAIATLVECCDTSFESDELGAAWWGMATWLTKVPDHFSHMVSQHSPAALIVLAHWAAFLVPRAENCGCWFLRGVAKTILLQVTERLPPDGRAAQNLVGSLIEMDL